MSELYDKIVNQRGSFERLVARCFAQRRKTLRNALRGLLDPEQLESAGVDPVRRAETVSLAEFTRLADAAAAGERRP